MEIPGRDVVGLYAYFTIRFQERRIRQGHDGQSAIIRVAQRQHGGILLRLAWDPCIEGFIYDMMVHGFGVI